MSAERRACPQGRKGARSRGADEWRKFAHTCLRRRGHGWHAPFGAPLPSLIAGSKSFLACVVVGKARAHERAARTILFVCARLASFTSPASGRGASEPIRVRGRYRCSEPSGNAPSSRPSPRARGEGARKRRETILFVRPRAAGDHAKHGDEDMRRFITISDRASVDAHDPYNAPSRGPPSPLCGAGWEISCDEN